MARTLELDTLDHPSNTDTANIVLSSDGTTTMPTVNINGGQIDATTVGASTPSSVAASTLSASGNATVGGTFGVTSNTTVGGTLGVTGATTLSSTAAITGNTTVGGTLGVTGNSTLSGTGNNVGTITTGTWSGTEVAVAKGGTGATTGATAITNLGVPQIIKYVHINGSDYRVYDTANSHYYYVCHDAISYSVVSGRSYKIEAQCSVKTTDDNDVGYTSVTVKLHASPTNRSQGANAASPGLDGVIKSGTLSVQIGAHGSEHQAITADQIIQMTGLYTATANTTHYTYFTCKGGTSSNGFWFSLNGADASGTHPTSGTDNSGVRCSFIITEIPSGVTLTNQDA
tara:strand:+ start:1276 stop:2304 length:1029 start_codon:yes stop_codon:yes gene_type:complete